MNDKQVRQFVEFSRSVALEAGGILKEGFNRSLKINYKGRIDPVTEYDLKAEERITERIAAAYPDHDILAEEGTDTEQASEFRWIVDPLDGTVNYSHGFPVYCTSIGLERNGEPIAAAVYDPERDEMFWSGHNMKAYLNDEVISVTTQDNLERCLIATGFAYDIATARSNNLGLFARMAKKVQGVRRPGSAAIDLCWLAAGRLDGFWELKLRPWDTAAARLIIMNAGGELSRIDGREWSTFDNDLLASNGKIHRQMQRILSPSSLKSERRPVNA